ncbi:hypothetical protein [Nocardia sp. NPDC050412]|uniref:hypothetical protein n=1 Tax=Nocardia sp. NPDC050412 TaxID=3364320 RepID=UPI003789C511
MRGNPVPHDIHSPIGEAVLEEIHSEIRAVHFESLRTVGYFGEAEIVQYTNQEHQFFVVVRAGADTGLLGERTPEKDSRAHCDFAAVSPAPA